MSDKPKLSEMVAAARAIISASPRYSLLGGGRQTPRMADVLCVACRDYHTPCARPVMARGITSPRVMFHTRRCKEYYCRCQRFVGPYARPLGLLK